MDHSGKKQGGGGILIKRLTRRFTRRPPREEVRPRSAEEIQTWLVEGIARQLGIGTDEMDIREPLASYGIDSRAAISLSGELEDWLGRRLSPTLVWDYPTIAELAAKLATDDGS